MSNTWRSETARTISSPNELADALQINFSDEQLDAICAPLEPTVIIAGAGSGKTTVMAARVVWLVGSGQVRPDQVLGLTFTRKAAGELASRVRNSLTRAGVALGAEDQAQEVVMTYDSFAGQLIGEHGIRMGMEAPPTMISGATRYRLASKVVCSAKGPYPGISRLRPAAVAEKVLSLDAEMRSHLVNENQIRDHATKFLKQLEGAPTNNRGNIFASIRDAISVVEERLDLVDLVDRYTKLKAELGVGEFADTLANAVELVRSTEAVPRLLRQQYAIVLLDEYQDTSSAQAQLLLSLFGDGHPVTAVGDPFQAIYGWRGAAASNITTFATEFVTRDGRPAKQFQLTVNRRSDQQILDVANEIGKTLRAVQVGERGLIGCLEAPVERRGGVVKTCGFETQEQEISWIAESIADLGRDPGQGWSDTAILVRRNADIGGLFEALNERDVPVEIVGLGGLLELPEISMILSTLSVLNDPTANADLVNLLSGQRWLLSPMDLRALTIRARELSVSDTDQDHSHTLSEQMDRLLLAQDPSESFALHDAILDPGKTGLSPQGLARINQFRAEMAGLLRHLDEPLVDLVRRVTRVLGIEFELASQPQIRTNPGRQLNAFIEAVAAYCDQDEEASLSGLLAYCAAEIEHGTGLEQAVPSSENSVKILTVHRAKGLEWSRVYLPGLAEKVFPSLRGTDNFVKQAGHLPAPLRGDAAGIPQIGQVSRDGLEDYAQRLREEQILAEDRLAYVAVTRARETLIGTWHMWAHGLQGPREPSRYFLALQGEALRQGNAADQMVEPADTNPLGVTPLTKPWPVSLDPAFVNERLAVAEWVNEDLERIEKGQPIQDDPLSLESRRTVTRWDEDLDRLLAQARSNDQTEIEIEVPESLSVTSAARLRADPDEWATAQLRRMPRPPSRGASLGTSFHSWVQHRFGLVGLFDDEWSTTSRDPMLTKLQDSFEAGPYAQLTPVAVEVPFILSLGGHLIRGRIDAVYAQQGQYDYQVVDWKTSNLAPDPIQLALYRLAWARASGIPLDRVDAVFYHVLSRRTERPKNLPDETELGLLPAWR